MPIRTPAQGVLPSTESQPAPESQHRLEQSVRRELLSHPELHFPSLVVRRIRSGVCLEGVVETTGTCSDVSEFAKRVVGVDRVLNRPVRHYRELDSRCPPVQNR